ncbi:MAG: beta-ketoacyl-ACP synthase II [Bdellovibrionota bacterium]
MNSKRVVVTGIGCVTSLGLNFEDFWKNILAAKSGISILSNIPSEKLSVKIGGEIKDFDAEKWINKKDLRRMDRFIQLGLAASFQACDQAQLDDFQDKKRVGTILSSGIGGLSLIEETVLEMAAGKRVSPFFIPSIISNLLPGQLSIIKGFKGVNYCITSACSSSAHAVGEGFRIIERGDADVMVVGGSEAPLTNLSISGFSSMKALSTRNDAPEKASRPFDVDRDGFVMSEGAATLVLESLESAQKRGVPILAEIIGYGTNSDAYHMTSPSEGGEGARDCMLLALKDGKTELTEVDYINMHGTSTGAGDVSESAAIESLFTDWKQHLLVSSTKSMTGHMLGAAGALEALVCIGAIRDSVIPPTINLENQDPECRLDYVPSEKRNHKVKKAMSNSFGFGGTNVSLLFSEFK